MFKFLLLGLLSERPRHGYELKSELDRLLVGHSAVNVGQVYTTLSRLERQRLVVHEVIKQPPMPDRKVFSVTERGREEFFEWLATPACYPGGFRREILAKTVLNLRLDLGDALQFLWQQREELIEALAVLERQRSLDANDPLTNLIIDGCIIEVEAGISLLDTCESSLDEIKRSIS